MSRLHCIIQGVVQGVGFRYYAQHCARTLSLNGWVRNLRGGPVETEVEGPRPTLESYLDQMRQGPAFSRVERIQITWNDGKRDSQDDEPARHENFTIRPTI